MGLETIGLALGATAETAATVGAMAAGTAASTALGVYQGQKAAGAQKSAQAQAAAQASSTAKAADEANNRINQKRPDTVAILAANAQAGKGGQAGTMLTGPQGVDPSTLQLGKNTLLGQ